MRRKHLIAAVLTAVLLIPASPMLASATLIFPKQK